MATAHSSAEATALAAAEVGVSVSHRIKLNDISALPSGAITPEQMGNVLRELRQQCGNQPKKLVLGLQVKVQKGEAKWKLFDSLPCVQDALLRYFNQAAPATAGNITGFTVYINPVGGQSSLMVVGNRTDTAPVWWFAAVKPDDCDAGKLWVAQHLNSNGVVQHDCYLKVAEADGRHPMAFPVNGAKVWVLAQVGINHETKLPAEVAKKMDHYKISVKQRIFYLPAETSHQLIEGTKKNSNCRPALAKDAPSSN